MRAQRLSQSRRNRAGERRARRKIERATIAVAIDVQFTAPRLKRKPRRRRLLTNRPDYEGGGQCGVSTEIDFDCGGEPSQKVAGALANIEGRLGEIVLRRYRKQGFIG